MDHDPYETAQSVIWSFRGISEHTQANIQSLDKLYVLISEIFSKMHRLWVALFVILLVNVMLTSVVFCDMIVFEAFHIELTVFLGRLFHAIFH